jgi:hypothetical protein
MNSADLRTALQELSEDVRTPDLLDRALRTARGIRRRRIAVAVTGTVAAVVATIVAISPWRGSDSGLGPATSTPPPNPTTSAPETTEYPIAGQTMTYLPGQQPATLRGTSYYLTHDDKPARSQLVRAHAGKVERTELPTDEFGTASVSPDGRWIAWVMANGSLTIADITGASPHAIAPDAVPMPFNVPAWTPDSTAIVYTASAGPIDGPRTTLGPTMLIPAGGGEAHRIWDSSLGFPAWSADGKHLGYVNGTGGAGVIDVEHATASAGPDLSGYGGAQYVGGISPDGKRIIVELGQLGTLHAWRTMQAPTLFDVATSAELPPPLPGPLSGGRFLPNGDVLVRQDTPNGMLLRQVNSAGVVVAESFEPQGLLRSALIGFRAD